MERSTSIWLAVIGYALIGAVALVSCVPHIEADIAERTDALVADAGWLSVEVDGQEVTLIGVAPTAEAAASITQQVEDTFGVSSVVSEVTYPEAAEPPAPSVEESAPVPAPVAESERATDEVSATAVLDEGAESTDLAVPEDTGMPESDELPQLTDMPEFADTPEPSEMPPNEPDAAPIAEVVAEPEVVTTVPTPEADPQAVDDETQEDAVPVDVTVVEPQRLTGQECQSRLDAQVAERSVFFEGSSTRLAPGSRPLLDDIAAIARDCANRIEVAGYADSIGSDPTSSKQLTEWRAQSVVTYLVSRGVPAGRLFSVGYGDARLRAGGDEGDAAGETTRRRIEFRVAVDS